MLLIVLKFYNILYKNYANKWFFIKYFAIIEKSRIFAHIL